MGNLQKINQFVETTTEKVEALIGEEGRKSFFVGHFNLPVPSFLLPKMN